MSTGVSAGRRIAGHPASRLLAAWRAQPEGGGWRSGARRQARRVFSAPPPAEAVRGTSVPPQRPRHLHPPWPSSHSSAEQSWGACATRRASAPFRASGPRPPALPGPAHPPQGSLRTRRPRRARSGGPPPSPSAAPPWLPSVAAWCAIRARFERVALHSLIYDSRIPPLNSEQAQENSMPGFFLGKGVGIGFGVGVGFGAGWGFGGASAACSSAQQC